MAVRVSPRETWLIRSTAVLATGLVAALAISGCASTAPLSLSVAHGPVGVDTDEGLVLRGAEPGEPVTITATAIDADGVTWASDAVYRADGDGVVDTAKTAPTDGDYSGTHGAGLIFSLAPPEDGGEVSTAFALRDSRMVVHYRAAQVGRQAAESEQLRSLDVDGVRTTETDLGSDGFVGTFHEPRKAEPGVAAVMVVGGDEGGLAAANVEAALLASHGHPALAVAYFGAEGLPAKLVKIRIEYFGKALRWLRNQPGSRRCSRWSSKARPGGARPYY